MLSSLLSSSFNKSKDNTLSKSPIKYIFELLDKSSSLITSYNTVIADEVFKSFSSAFVKLF